MKTVVTKLIGALLLAAAVVAQAQLPAPPATAVRTNPPAASSFFAPSTNFNRLQRTPAVPNPGVNPAANRAVPVIPGGTPATPGATLPNVPGGAIPTAAAGGATTGVSNVIPRGITNIIPANVIRFQEADISQILEFYAELTGKTLLKSPQVPLTTKISIRNTTQLTKEEGINALNTILGLNQIAMIPQGEKFIKVVPQANVGPEATPFTTNTYEELPDSQVPVAQIITLKNLTPEDAVSILTPYAKLPGGLIGVKGSPVLVLRDYAENVKRMMEILERVDVALPLEIETVVIPIKYALAGEIASVLSGLGASTGSGISGGAATAGGFTSGGGGTLGGQFGGSTGLGGQQFGGGIRPGVGGAYSGGTLGGGQYGGARSFGTQGGIGSPGGFGASRTGFGNRLNTAIRSAVGAAGGAGAGDFILIGQAKIIPDDRSNALLVFADRRDLAMISNIISKIDVVLPQVLIEALIMEVNLDDGKNIGVSLKQNVQDVGDLSVAGGSLNKAPFIDPKTITAISGLSTNLASGFSYFGKLNEDFDFAVTAAATDTRINVLSRPRIQTSTAKPAHIFVGETRPYVTGTYFSGLSSGSQSQVSQTQIGITLDVMPIVNQDGLVTMDIQQHISQVGGQVPIDGNNVPITIERDANGYVSVNNRETILLGGFISTTKNVGKSGVPYLKDIPGLGVLFRSSTESIQRVELMVLIRPTVLPTPEAAAIAAANMRDSMPNIIRAERDIDEYARKRLEKERKEQEKMEQRGQ